MSDATTFKASFNRPNLYYEVRKKQKNRISSFLFINNTREVELLLLKPQKSGGIAQVLQVNGISAYHTTLD
jgi:ATP-dependent DNA helicase RecQ